MSVLDCVFLGIGTIIIPGLLYSWVLLTLAGAFPKKNKKISENESSCEEYTEEIVDNKDSELGHNRTDYRFTASSSMEKWIDGYEKNI